MVLMRRQTSHPGYAIDYGEYDAPRNFQRHKSDQHIFQDPELRRNVYEDYEKVKKKPTLGGKILSIRRTFILIQYLIFAGVLFYAWKSNNKLSKTTAELQGMYAEQEALSDMIVQTEMELRNAHADFMKLQMNFNTLKPFDRRMNDPEGRQEMSQTLMERHDAQAKRILDMQRKIQEIHYNDLKER